MPFCGKRLADSPEGLGFQKGSHQSKDAVFFCFECSAHTHECACVSVLGAQGGQKRVSDLLELELQMVVNHCAHAGTR